MLAWKGAAQAAKHHGSGKLGTKRVKSQGFIVALPSEVLGELPGSSSALSFVETCPEILMTLNTSCLEEQARSATCLQPPPSTANEATQFQR